MILIFNYVIIIKVEIEIFNRNQHRYESENFMKLMRNY